MSEQSRLGRSTPALPGQWLLGIPDLNGLGVPWKNRGTYWRLYSSGRFPAPVKLASKNEPLRWRASDIKKWLDSRKPKI